MLPPGSLTVLHGVSLLKISNMSNEVYGVHQLIAEPARVTPFSQTLIDLCITNSPLSIVKSGVVQLSISDHSLVYVTRKVTYGPCGRTNNSSTLYEKFQ